MKPLFLGLALAIPLQAQVPTTPVPAPAPLEVTASQALRTDAELNTLLGPIALYPDALIGIILPASTVPANIVLAARAVDQKATADSIAAQPWDDSVKALTHYPDLLRWLDQNLTWTQAVGEAFKSQPADVMNTMQRLRQQARAAGTLVDTPQQLVVAEENTVRIVPAQPDVIYVPVYDPAVVYVSQTTYIGHRHIHFHRPYPCGPWLTYRPDWHHHHMVIIGHGHSYSYGGHRNYAHYSSGHPIRVWTPPAYAHSRPRHIAPPHRPHAVEPSRNITRPRTPFRDTPASNRPVVRETPRQKQQPKPAERILPSSRNTSPAQVRPDQSGLIADEKWPREGKPFKR